MNLVNYVSKLEISELNVLKGYETNNDRNKVQGVNK